MALFGLSLFSWLAVAVIAASLALAFSRRFMASGAIAIACVAVFLLGLAGPTTRVVPGVGGQDALPFAYPAVQAELALWEPNLRELHPLGLLQLATLMFVHGDLWHLAGNMIGLLAFGIPFEERIGHRRFLAIYLLAGVAGSLLQFGLDLHDPRLAMGASGAVFGVLGAFAARYPNQVVGIPVPIGIMFIVRMRVIIGALLYTAVQVLLIVSTLAGGSRSSTGFGAHLGGLAAGLLLARVLVNPREAAGRVAVDLDRLAPFARDAPTRQVLGHMAANHDEPAVFQAWLDRFFRTATCPTCGHKVVPRAKGEVVCTQNHRFDVRRQAAQPISPPRPSP